MDFPSGESDVATATKTDSAPVKFPAHSDLRARLNAAVDQYFKERGIAKDGGWRILLKTGLIVAWAAVSWTALVIFAENWWHVLIAGMSLGLSIAGIGFNVMHDGGHHAFSKKRWVNRWSGRMLDLIGGSSYLWNQKHNILHHQFTNVKGVDEDIEAEPFLRLSPHQEHRSYHRFQFLYIWVLLGFFLPRWQWHDDFSNLAKGRVGDQKIPRPKGFPLVWLFMGKLLFFSWALIIPLILHAWLPVLLTYAYVCLVTGITIATVFQLAHCVEETAMLDHPDAGERLPQPWAEHQLATTADFAPRSRFLAWYLGGLNYQVEHHLFPRVSHIHYPKLIAVVRGVCKEMGVKHHCNPSMIGAISSHIRFLRKMGYAAAAS